MAMESFICPECEQRAEWNMPERAPMKDNDMIGDLWQLWKESPLSVPAHVHDGWVTCLTPENAEWLTECQVRFESRGLNVYVIPSQ